MIGRNVESVKEFYEKTAQDYDKDYETPYWKLYDEITWENIKHFIPKRRDCLILDAGGGTGHWGIRLAKHGYRVVLTDISENMLKVARKKIKTERLQAKIETRVADIGDMSSFKSNCFDMVLAEGDPVSYCLNAKKATKELTRVAKSNAPVIVSVDSKYSILSRLVADGSFDQLSRLINKGTIESREGAFEFQAFAPQELGILFEKCGLRLVRMIGKPIVADCFQEKRGTN